MDSLIIWSGWIFTIISTTIAVIQYFDKKKYIEEINQLKIKNQQNTFNATDKGVAINENKGDITIR